MNANLDRRLAKLEAVQPGPDRPYCIMPEPCSTTAEWLQRLTDEKEGKGSYVLQPLAPNSCIRYKKWVPSPNSTADSPDQTKR